MAKDDLSVVDMESDLSIRVLVPRDDDRGHDRKDSIVAIPCALQSRIL